MLGFYLKFRCLDDKVHPSEVALFKPPHRLIQPTWPTMSGDVVGLVQVTARLRVLRIVKTVEGLHTHFEVIAETGLIRGSERGWVPHWHVKVGDSYEYEEPPPLLNRYSRPWVI